MASNWAVQVVRPLLLAVLLTGTAHASLIEFSVANLGANAWRYAYEITNDSLPGGINEFTIHFDRALYSGLSVSGTPAGWDSLVVQPDPAIPANGFFDSLALAQPLALGSSLSGFAVDFIFLGAGTPGVQPFDIVDPATFAVLASGTTQPAQIGPPPPNGTAAEPASAVLLFTALLLGGLMRRKFTH
jgi:hypothetical protein